MSDALPLIFGSLGGVAALVAVYLTWLGLKAKREAEDGALRVDALGLGVSSMKDALQLNKNDIADLRKQLQRQADDHEELRIEWRRELMVLRARLEAAEAREAACWERVQELMDKIEEMSR